MHLFHRINNFEVPAADVRLSAEVLTADEILRRPMDAQTRLKDEVERLFVRAFPHMPREGLEEFITHYFRLPPPNFQTQTILIRNEQEELVATTLFDQGVITYEQTVLTGVYIHVRAIIEGYQEFGLGRIMAQKILRELHPDILFTTCAQSASLHSWIGLCPKHLISGYEVFPRIEERNGEKCVVTVPYKELDFVITLFKQLFLVGVAEGKSELVTKAIRNLTVRMTRKQLGMHYGFDPWQTNGREDFVAKTLGVGVNDGIVVMFRKISG